MTEARSPSPRQPRYQQTHPLARRPPIAAVGLCSEETARAHVRVRGRKTNEARQRQATRAVQPCVALKARAARPLPGPCRGTLDGRDCGWRREGVLRGRSHGRPRGRAQPCREEEQRRVLSAPRGVRAASEEGRAAEKKEAFRGRHCGGTESVLSRSTTHDHSRCVSLGASQHRDKAGERREVLSDGQGLRAPALAREKRAATARLRA